MFKTINMADIINFQNAITIHQNSTPKPKLCLNMIVKNEAAIIRDTLQNIVDHTPVEYWVISDTGSTDGTQQIINDFFREKGIPGELYQDDWVDFAHNRTKALQYAYNKSDFLLIFDADDRFIDNLELPSADNECNAFFLILKMATIEYQRILLIRNNERWRFVGVLHELIQYADVDQERHQKLTCRISASSSGNRASDPDKFNKDAAILEKAYKEAYDVGDKIYIRYIFYCANSYYWANNKEKAIEWYKKGLETEMWYQEKYISCMNLYNMYKSLNNTPEAIYYLLKSITIDKERVEGIHKLVEHYVVEGDSHMAYHFYKIVQNTFENNYNNTAYITDKLFTDVTVLHFYLPYIMIIAADRVKEYDTVMKMCKIIFEMKPHIFNEFYIGNLFFNMSLYIDRVNQKNDTEFKSLFKDYVKFLRDNNMSKSVFDNIHKFIDWLL